MTIQQAIDKIAFLYKTDVDCYHQAIAKGFYWAASGHRQDMEAHQMALEALREKAKREDPCPLTLEELRQMDTLPVYVSDLKRPAESQYCIISVDNEKYGDKYSCAMIGGIECDWYDFDKYGDTWIAYRHKPKEELP